MSPLRWMQALPPPHDEFSHKRALVLHRLALAMSRDGTGWVSVERLAAEAGVTRATVSRVIDWAINDAKILDRIHRGHRVSGKRPVASTYRLLPGKDAL